VAARCVCVYVCMYVLEATGDDKGQVTGKASGGAALVRREEKRSAEDGTDEHTIDR
jgi:hypothetical protein